MQSQSTDRRADAALTVLAALQLLMLMALFARTPPHPPLEAAPFAMAPFLSASISTALAALVLGSTRSLAGSVVSGVAAALALLSFGPQKWADPAIGRIWPAVLLAQLAVVALAWSLLATGRSGYRQSKSEN